MPVDMRSVEASWSSRIDVIGSTETPLAAIRNGYSLVPWAVPRYFTTRRRRVDTWSTMR